MMGMGGTTIRINATAITITTTAGTGATIARTTTDTSVSDAIASTARIATIVAAIDSTTIGQGPTTRQDIPIISAFSAIDPTPLNKKPFETPSTGEVE